MWQKVTTTVPPLQFRHIEPKLHRAVVPLRAKHLGFIEKCLKTKVILNFTTEDLEVSLKEFASSRDIQIYNMKLFI